MMITERQGEILNRIVQEYIDLAQPISSEFLEEKHHLGICPATIRIEMQKLTDLGYIYQPHTSAGRIPTDWGYRFFVDTLLKREIPEFEDVFEIEDIFQGVRKDIFKLASRLTKFVAEESSSFTILNLLERDFLLKEGWEGILLEPEFEEKDLISDFTELLEGFEENIKNFRINSGIKIYIGKENPFSKTKNFSIISSKCCFPDEDYNPPTTSEGPKRKFGREAGGSESRRLRRRAPAIISLLGPKRMAYDKNISLINSLTKLLEKL